MQRRCGLTANTFPVSGDRTTTYVVQSDQDCQLQLMLTGVYTIADEGSDARLMYQLEIPDEPQELQEQLKIGKTGDYSMQIKVPSSRQILPFADRLLAVCL